MSIVKNSVGVTNDMTVTKLPKDTKLYLLPIPSGHPLGDYTTMYYLTCTSSWFRLGFYPRAGETVIIKALIPTNASGTIYGIEGSSGRCIKAENGNLNWYNGSTVVLTRELDGKIHNFGYEGYDDSGTLKCRPYYDKEVLTTIEGSTSSDTSNKAVIGASCAATPANIVSSMTLYEIVASSYPSSSDTTQYDFHYYAALNASSVACLMETRHDLTGVTHTGTSVEAGNFPLMGYGVQLNDLKAITGSGYKDVISILTEDGGLDTETGFDTVGSGVGTADAPSALVQDDDKRLFAFSLKSMPRPSGWTYSEHDPAVSSHHADGYVSGELHDGRTPKWSIWQDSVAFGFYPLLPTGASEYKLHFNILKRPDTSTRSGGGTIRLLDDFRLESFHGYNTNSDTNHPPVLDFSDTQLTLYVHNGAITKCFAEDVMAGNPGSVWGTGSVTKDNDCIFTLNETVGGAVHSRIGNLAPWNFTYTDMCNVGWFPIGYKVVCSFLQSLTDYLVSPVHKSEVANKYLTGSADAEVQTLYRATGFDDSLQLGEHRWYLLDWLEGHNNQTTLYATLSMIADDNKDIDCSEFIPRKAVQVVASHDVSMQSGSTNYRMVLNAQASIGIVAGTSRSGDWSTDPASEHVPTKKDYGSGGVETVMWLPFIKCNSSGPVVETYAEAYTHDYIGVIELFYVKSDTYRYASVIKTNINRNEFQTSYIAGYNEWKAIGDTYRYAYWKDGVKTKIPLHSGTNDDLYSSVRFMVATGRELGLQDGSYFNIPDDSTAVVSIYEKATAPTFWKLKGAVWDSSHHTPVFQNIDGYYYQFEKPWDTNYGTSLGRGKLGFLVFTYDSTTHTYTKVDEVGTCYIHIWKNGTYYGYQTLTDEDYAIGHIYGLNGAYFTDLYAVDLTMSNLTNADVIEIQLKATTSI